MGEKRSEIDILKEQLAGEVEARKTAEERLRKLESDLNSVTENIQDVYYRSNAEGKLIMVSRSWLVLAGYDSFDECIGKDIAETFYYNPEDRKKFLELLKKEGRVRNYETVLKRKDGTPVFVETSSHLYYNRDGNLAGVEGILRDISERKKAEDELRRSEEFLKSIVNASPVPQFVIDRNHRVIHWNRALEEYSRIRFEEVRETDAQWRAFYNSRRPCLADLVVDDATELITEWYSGKYSRSKLVADAYEAVDFFPDIKDGTWLHFTAAPIKDSNGEIAGAVETLADITEARKALLVLRESEERFRTIFENSPLGIVLTTLDGKIISANRFFCDLTGYSEAEIHNMNIAEVSFEGDFEKERPLVRKYRDGQRNYYTFEKRYKTKTGETVWGHVSISYIHDEEGNPVSAIGIVENMTDRKKADEELKKMENQLIQSQKVEALGTLAGGIAHDFNNILSSIIGYTELARLHVDNSDRTLADLNKVLKASGRAKNLINQILSFSRKATVEYAPVDLHLAIKDSLNMLRSVIPSDIEIIADLEENVMVMSDPTQIHQIIMNLSINAAQAMERDGGKLTVALNSEYIDEKNNKNMSGLKTGWYAAISVKDTGHGMSPEMLDKIFLPYFTTREVGHGTGLGLAVIQGIIKNHKGGISCSSEPGKGTSFYLYIPELKTFYESAESEGEEDKPETGSGNILFVDDESSLADIAAEMLKTIGYNVTAETSSMKALELFMEKPDCFDLVITDMTMPVMKGDRFAEKIKSVRGDIPVIMCTGYSDRISDERIKELGIDKLCMKPLELSVLARIVSDVMKGEK
ncbi:MAG TPA: PAS domain S-box protein [Spirochaetota bacterium]|nr:PAS domain S-box protein [Spirochaetota bacterium]HPJ34692.1 PAS domain S-box protein [Spirochaetota bacterium]